MNLLDWLQAIIKLGLPVLLLTWLVFRWVYRRGDIDRNANHKAVAARLKEMKSTFKADKTNKPHFVYRRWMTFGTGFYGMTGLWTFIEVETADLIRLLMHPVSSMSGFTDDPLGFILNVLINQLGNFIAALAWFAYWGEDGNFLVWVAMAWAGYWIGIKLARRDHAAVHLDRWEQQLESGWQKLQARWRRQ